MEHDEILSLDPVVHAPHRLAIMTILISVKEATFMYLREATGMKDGNLSTHLSKLEEAGYISIKKSFVGKKPQTTCAITEKGREAFLSYLDQMERIVKAQKQE
jgi:DNA-binding MarR family transcriptional regulator